MKNTKYISFDDIWNILSDVEYNNGDPSLALVSMCELLMRTGVSIFVNNNELVALVDFDYSDYKYSTSVIGGEDEKYRTETMKQQVDRIAEAKRCIEWITGHINFRFHKHDPIYLNVFYERYFLNQNINDIKKKYAMNNKRYYAIIETAEYLAKRAWLLITPPPAFLAFVEGKWDPIKNK